MMSQRLLSLLVLVSVFLLPATSNLAAHEAPAGNLLGAVPQPNAEIAAVLASAKQVTAGDGHTCALTSQGGVKCWGYNGFGQLGDGTTASPKPTPQDVSGLTSGVTQVAAGYYHTCALTSGGGVKCWGANYYGQLGDGTTTSGSGGSPVPVDVSGLMSGVKALSAGYGHTCALTTDGGIKCWGYNIFGQLGDGTTTDRTTPVAVSGLANGVTQVIAGFSHTCAVTSGGALRCWGANSSGQLGDGTAMDSSTPVDVSGLTTGVIAAAASAGHTCAVTTAGGVQCWGYNQFGQLGDGTTTGRTTPVAVIGLTSGVTAIAAVGYHTCAQTSSGGVKCWGYNASGRLGDGTTVDRTTPVAVSGLANGVTAVAAGRDHTCALVPGSGAIGVKCWGWNGFGQLGDGTLTDRTTPVDVLVPCTASSPADVVLAVDRSGSMGGQPLADAKAAVKSFVDQMNLAGGDQAALLAFNDNALVMQSLTSNGAAVKSAVDALSADGGTDIAEAIRDAQEELLSARHAPGNRRVLLLLSDGRHSAAGDPLAAAAQAKSNGIYIVTVGLGADVDAALLGSIASSPADYHYAPNSADLAAAYNAVAASIGCLTPAASCPGATIRSLGSGDWQTAANWDQNRVPNGSDVVLVQAGSQLTAPERLQMQGLCNYGLIQGGASAAMQIVATQFITNYGQIVGRDGAAGTAGACGQPGQGLKLGGGTTGIPVGNWGTIRGGNGGAGEACGGVGGLTEVFGRNTTNQGTICGGAGGDLVGNVANAYAGKGGDTHLWGKWGGPGFLANTGLACGGDGGDANPQAAVRQYGGCGGDLKLISLPDVLLDGGTHYAGRGGQGVNGGGKGCDGRVFIEPGVISLSGPDTTIWGGDVAIVGGRDWTLDLRNIGSLTATGELELAVGPGGTIDLRGNAGRVFQAAGTKIAADTVLLDPGVTLTELAGGNVVIAPGQVVGNVSLTGPGAGVVEPGVTTQLGLTLLNGGPEADTYTLAVEDERGWVLSGLPGAVQVEGLSGQTLTLSVQPSGGGPNVVTVTATSQSDPNRSASAEMTLYPGLEATARREGNGLVLSWMNVPAIASYQIWRYTRPYFNLASPPADLVATGLPPTGCTLAGETITCPLPGGVDNADLNYFYVVRGIRSGGSWTDFGRTGEFDFKLTAGG